MSKISKRPTVAMPTVAKDKAITAAAKADPNAHPRTPKQLQAMVPLKAVRGRPKLESKKLLVSVRYSPEVVAYFRSTGEDWQCEWMACYSSTLRVTRAGRGMRLDRVHNDFQLMPTTDQAGLQRAFRASCTRTRGDIPQSTLGNDTQSSGLHLGDAHGDPDTATANVCRPTH